VGRKAGENSLLMKLPSVRCAHAPVPRLSIDSSLVPCLLHFIIMPLTAERRSFNRYMLWTLIHSNTP
jgi:hypothetical protein